MSYYTKTEVSYYWANQDLLIELNELINDEYNNDNDELLKNIYTNEEGLDNDNDLRQLSLKYSDQKINIDITWEVWEYWRWFYLNWKYIFVDQFQN